ncbi:unnamed protein product [Coregonus sp. 'balchen']|nr:unnamed protein product [Coregonus sp. 'balchen']
MKDMQLSDLQADSEEVQRTAQQLKKKCQRLTAELQDTKLHLEGQQSRNHDLEKKQRKFDSEQNLSQEEVQREKNIREKLSREKDMLTGEVFSLRQQLQDKDLEMCAQNVKLEQLEAELLDLSSQETKDEASLSKLKQIEVQLEEEYDDKQKVLRERRDLETKLLSAQDQVNPRDVETEKRLRKDLKRTKALLADAQIMLDHMKNNAPSKREIAQLKNQLEEQLSRLQREKNDLQSRMEEDQEDMNELMKKHKSAVAQSTQNLAQISDLQAQLEEALKEKQDVQEKLSALQSQLEFQETSMVEKSLVSRQEAKIREMETKMEFEKTQVKRLESLVARLKENLEKLTEERDHRSTSETREKEQNKRLQRQIRDIKEEMGELAKKEGEASRKKHELEMDIESLEAANQSLQADLKLAFKRIGDLQAAIEDEMESDDNEDLINSLQDMVTKYQKRRNKTEGDSSDSEVEDRVDGVKSWLSKNKGSTKNLSDDGSLKSSRFAVNIDAKEEKEWKEGKEWKELNKEGKEKEVDQSRPVSVMSSLSYRKRSNINDSIGGKGDDSSLFSSLKKDQDSQESITSFRKAKPKGSLAQDDSYSVSSSSWRKSQTGDDDDRGSVISQAYTEATSRARKGMDSRWGDFDKESTVSSMAPSRASVATTRRGLRPGDDTKSTIRLGIRHSGGRSPGSMSRADSRISDFRSCRLSEFDDMEDGHSVAFTERSSAYSPHSSTGRSLSMPPPRARSSFRDDDEIPDTSDVKPATVSHRNYLDPDLEKAINEVLNFKPIKFKRTSLEDSEAEAGKKEEDTEDDRKSVLSVRGRGDREVDSGRSTNSLRRSASAVDCRRSSSSMSSRKGEREAGTPAEGQPPPNKKEEKSRKKKVDNLMMKYLYRPDSD